MASGLHWKFDNRVMVRAAVRAAAAEGLADAAEYLLQSANETVPIEEGVLAGSGSTDVDPGGLRASVFYDTAYAARQHEELRYRHDPGRRAKWLELTLSEESNQIRDHIAASIRRAL
jgi:hypothetical protein